MLRSILKANLLWHVVRILSQCLIVKSKNRYVKNLYNAEISALFRPRSVTKRASDAESCSSTRRSSLLLD